jgi:hypothetical protein
VCRRIASSPAKQAEFKVWAKKLGYEDPGIIGGYRIRWNIAYESRNWAYNARKVREHDFSSSFFYIAMLMLININDSPEKICNRRSSTNFL